MTSKTKFTLLIVLMTFSCLLASNTFADGPHWSIPEPPEDEYDLIEEEAEEIKKIKAAIYRYVPRGRMVKGKFVPLPKPKEKKRDNKTVIKDLTLFCIRYLREFEQYVSAPDSPNEWKTEEGREKMEEDAREYLALLARKDTKHLELIVDAWADTHRFASMMKTGAGNPKVKALIAAERELTNFLAKADEEMTGWRKKTQEQLSKAKSKKQRDAIQDKYRQRAFADQMKWRSYAQKYTAAYEEVKKYIPKTFVDNRTDDIPMLQDDGPSRMDAVIRKIGTSALPFLSKMKGHRSSAVARRARELCKTLSESFSTTKRADIEVLLRQIKPKHHNEAPIRSQLKARGNGALYYLMEIAREKDSDLNDAAFKGLSLATGMLFGSNLEKWETFLKPRLAKFKPPQQPNNQPSAPRQTREPKVAENPFEGGGDKPQKREGDGKKPGVSLDDEE